MDEEHKIETDIELAVADAVWRHETAKRLGRPLDPEDVPLSLRGEPGSDQRRAYDQRWRAWEAWRAARGLADGSPS